MVQKMRDGAAVRIAAGFLACFPVSLCAAQSIVNPVAGVWANRQPLVIEVPSGGIAYYSLNGDDPESSGFAYDGPVLLDVDGQVLLRVAVVSPDGSKLADSVEYTVSAAPLPAEEDAQAFVKDISFRGILDYTAGDGLAIPPSLEYSVGRTADSFDAGTVLSVSADAALARCVPCTVTDGMGRWRFVINIVPAASGVFSRRDVPFEIEDWNTVRFTDREFIYKIDDSWWHRPDVAVRLDRTQSHMISWQRIDYSPENPVKFFVLPQKPQIVSRTDKNGAVFLSFAEGDGYQLGLLDESGNPSALHERISIDTFRGDACEGAVSVGFFYDSVYQGELSVSYSVNRRNPRPPLIESPLPGGFSRGAVSVSVQAEDGMKVFASVSGPVVLNSDYTLSAAETLLDLQQESYAEAGGRKFTLSPSADGAAAYRVCAFAENENGASSRIAVRSFVIDPYNYYIDGSADGGRDADGTKERPFSTFAQALPALKKTRLAVIRVSGAVSMPEGRTLVSSNCELAGSDGAQLVFPPNSSLVVRNASFSVSNCILSVSADASSVPPSDAMSNLIQLEHGVLDLQNVAVSGSFGRNGTLIDSDNSVISIRNSELSASAESYASLVGAVQSKISVQDAKLAAVADTAVLVSAQGGLFELRGSSCMISGGLGRVAELFDAHSSITDNLFSADLRRPQKSCDAVYMDGRTLSMEFSGNSIAGF